MVTELLYYLFSLFKELLCSEHPIAVATLCASPGRLCCLARTWVYFHCSSFPCTSACVSPCAVSCCTLISQHAAIVGGLYPFCARWECVVSYTGCASLVSNRSNKSLKWSPFSLNGNILKRNDNVILSPCITGTLTV